MNQTYTCDLIKFFRPDKASNIKHIVIQILIISVGNTSRELHISLAGGLRLFKGARCSKRQRLLFYFECLKRNCCQETEKKVNLNVFSCIH